MNSNDSAVCAEITPPGFKFVNCPRKDRKGGGTGLLAREDVTVRMLDAGEKLSFEFSEWDLRVDNNNSLLIVIIYRAPFSLAHPITVSSFIAEFTEYLESLIFPSCPLLITGDFNTRNDDNDDVDSLRFLEFIKSMGLEQHVHTATHAHGHILDLVITRQSDYLISRTPFVDEFISDHASLLTYIQVSRSTPLVRKVTYRKLKSVNIVDFQRDILDSGIDLHSDMSLDGFVSFYNSTLHDCLEKDTPITTRTISVRPRVAWFSEEINCAKREKTEAERNWRTTKLQTHLLQFKRKRAFCTYLMKKVRSEYYSTFINDSSSDQRKLFKASKCLLNLKDDIQFPPHSDAFELANDFGNFFRQRIVDIRSKLPDLNSPETSCVEQEACLTSCFSEFVTLEESEVSRLISSSNLKSCALDPLPACLVSGCINVLLPSITKMINLSLTSGHFPAEWKMALVIPLLKKRGLDPILKNYRPISNLQFVSKLVERSVFNQLHKYLLSNNLYPIFQSAYRVYHSTETALLKVKNDLLLNMDRGHVTLLVLLDLSSLLMLLIIVFCYLDCNIGLGLMD